MPRREQPLGAGTTVLVEFARDLRRLREQVGRPTYRTLSTRVHYSAAALSEAASGRKLPSLAVTLAYVAGCAGDTEAWETRWRETAAELSATNGHKLDECSDAVAPYVGLAAFQPGDSDRFFGRDRLVTDLLARVRNHRFVGVFGASGSGKSSLLRAGLAANLTDHEVVIFTPGPNPVEECAVCMAAVLNKSPAALRTELAADPGNLHLLIRQAMADRPAEADLILVVDQFEEVFTVCPDDDRDWLIDALALAASAKTSRTRVVLGVRADFYGRCGQHPRLVEALRDGQLLVGPMTADELRLAITQPASNAGCRVETALVARLVSDATGQPSALPLVSHALLETWRRRRGATLTLDGYEAAGGIQHAIARSAEDVYRSLDDEQRRLARQLFLRLTALGDGTEDTKRRVSRTELDHDDADIVLERLAGARLVTLDRDGVELAHEAVIRHWQRLRDWLAEDREGLRIHRELTEATEAWEALDRDPGALYRGARLARADAWATTQHGTLSARERTFLDASLAAQAGEQAAVVRQARRLRRLAALLAVLLLVAVTATGYAVYAQQTATRQRNAAIIQNALREAGTMRISNFELAAQLTLAAYRLEPTPVTRSNVVSMVGWSYDHQLVGHSDRVRSMSYSSDGSTLVTASNDNLVRRWDIADPSRFTEQARLDGSAADPASRDRTARPSDATDNRHPRGSIQPKGHIDGSTSVALSPDGRRLATVSLDGLIRVWSVADRDSPTLITTIDGTANPVFSLVFGPGGDLLAFVSNNEIHLYDLTGPRRLASVSGEGGRVASVGFSPDGHTLAVAGDDRVVRLWDITERGSPRVVAALNHQTSVVTSAAFSPDGGMLGTVGADGTVHLWDLSDHAKPFVLATVPAELGPVSAIAFGPGGHTLAVAGNDNTVRLLLTDVERAAARLCQLSSARDISPADWARYFPGLDYRPPCV